MGKEETPLPQPLGKFYPHKGKKLPENKKRYIFSARCGLRRIGKDLDHERSMENMVSPGEGGAHLGQYRRSRGRDTDGDADL